MTSSTNFNVIQESFRDEDNLNDLFAELDELEPFDIKKEELAAQLAALLSYSGETRSGLASKCGWKKSRVSNILNGRGNPTFKTLWEFARYLGYEADLHFRGPTELPAKQPWNCRKLDVKGVSEFSSTLYLIELQTAREVAKDLLEGNHKDSYIGITTLTYPNTFEQTRQLMDQNTSQKLPILNIPKLKTENKELICQITI